MSKGTFVRHLLHVIRFLRRRMPVLDLPLRFPPRGTGFGVPLRPAPRWPGLREVYRTGLFDIPGLAWDIRWHATRREAALAMDRLVFVIEGYREPPRLHAPGPERPVAKP